MMTLGPLVLASPWALAGLASLPALWWLIRRRPPVRPSVMFPPLALLGDARQAPPPARTPPWWLLLLRLGALLLLLLGLAGPSWRPDPPPPPGRLLLVLDNGWTSAGVWEQLRTAALRRLQALPPEAQVAVMTLASHAGAVPPRYASPAVAARVIEAADAHPWRADGLAAVRLLAGLAPPDQTLLLTDGLDGPALDPLIKALPTRGLAIQRPPHAPVVIRMMQPVAGGWQVQLVRPQALEARDVVLEALDAAGDVVGENSEAFPAGESVLTMTIAVPPALAAKVSRLRVRGQAMAAGVSLIDAGSTRPRVVLVGEASGARTLQSGLYYLRRALEPYADLVERGLDRLPPDDASILILDDAPLTPGAQSDALLAWVRKGGVAITFAGPRIAENGTALAPAPLRRGARNLGGRLSWGSPQPVGGFAQDGPFARLPTRAEVTVAQQVLPLDPAAAERWAWLADETPLVSAKPLGAGLLVLVHTTAGPEWTSLPLSGQYEAMLKRLMPLARNRSARAAPDGAPWTLDQALDARGDLIAPASPSVIADDTPIGPAAPPGLYRAGGASVARNMAGQGGIVTPFFRFKPLEASIPQAQPEGRQLALAPPLLLGGLLLLVLDALLLLGVGWHRPVLAALLVLLVPLPARAQFFGFDAPPPRARSPSELVQIGWVRTAGRDAASKAGLQQLANALATRTAVQPAVPTAVDPARDALGAYAMIYWPIAVAGPPLTPQIADRVRRYLEEGGLVLFDVVDSSVTQGGLRSRLAALGLPPLEPLTEKHVLARTFYLLREVRGADGPTTLWVETGTKGDSGATTGVVIGAGDFARAWASGDNELALRTGINLVVYALTGTYKADQAHVKALLDRLERTR